MKKRKGFTLIELLAVIVILGLLMAIAIPSITKYITQSRKKTITTTIGNYIGALINQVNDMEYTFTATNTVYAVPIECVSLERGGTNPFGEWYQANNVYWAYVLVQYDDNSSSYTYGFTFKDSAGYGLYPTTSEKLNESGKQINTNLDLTRPTNGTITNITAKTNWTGFDIDDNTNLVVLEATSEGEEGDGKTTCTLCQKGKNYVQAEEEKEERDKTLAKLIKKNNTLITTSPTLTTSSNNSSDASGLYVSYETNSGQPTYYFRGDVTNNNVKFAGFNWKIIRINEDGTVRLISDDDAIRIYSMFNSSRSNYTYFYYSNSDSIKVNLENWYRTNIIDKGYDGYIATELFCEQAKVKQDTRYTSGSATMDVSTSYIPNFKCSIDGNGKGILNNKVGLITVDELIYGGGYFGTFNLNYYLDDNNKYFWTMSPSGFYNKSTVWFVGWKGIVQQDYLHSESLYMRPVINLNANVLATGTGTWNNPYLVQTK